MNIHELNHMASYFSVYCPLDCHMNDFYWGDNLAKTNRKFVI